MKVLAIFVLNVEGKTSRIVQSATDLEHISWMKRSGITQVMTFTAKTVAERTEPGQRQFIDDDEFSAYIYRPQSPGDLVAVAVTDKQYPSRAANCIGPQVLNQFTSTFSRTQYSGSGVISSWPWLVDHLRTVQSPDDAMDKISKIQTQLDSTKEIMHKNIEQTLARGENLEVLMDKTSELDASTKMFVKSARKANRGCCSLQ